MEIVIASRNLHKIREYREMFKVFPSLDILSLLDFSDYEPAEVSGTCFKENAMAKAQHAAQSLQKWVLADDAGIVIPVLGGGSGRDLRFFSNDDRTEAENRLAVLRALQGKSDLQRSAYLECSLALANEGKIQKCVTGICEGVIVEQEKGRHGFGYDAIFRKHDYDKTFAELDEAIKIRVSDRRKAFEKLALYLETLLP